MKSKNPIVIPPLNYLKYIVFLLLKRLILTPFNIY
nr:MAG TPA: hypothetical protein [Caudoviricetes sp.]